MTSPKGSMHCRIIITEQRENKEEIAYSFYEKIELKNKQLFQFQKAKPLTVITQKKQTADKNL
jgi:hypothetical protein